MARNLEADQAMLATVLAHAQNRDIQRAAAIAKLKREVNAKFGRFMLRSGATLFLCEIYRDVAYGYEICDVREKMCF